MVLARSSHLVCAEKDDLGQRAVIGYSRRRLEGDRVQQIGDRVEHLRPSRRSIVRRKESNQSIAIMMPICLPPSTLGSRELCLSSL